jgi:hypothetical protein
MALDGKQSELKRLGIFNCFSHFTKESLFLEKCKIFHDAAREIEVLFQPKRMNESGIHE